MNIYKREERLVHLSVSPSLSLSFSVCVRRIINVYSVSLLASRFSINVSLFVLHFLQIILKCIKVANCCRDDKRSASKGEIIW